MSSTQPTTQSTSPLSPAPTTSVVNNSPAASLGKNAFLDLLVTQLKNQDPTSPMDSTAFMSQLAQFSSLEQMTNISSSMTGLASTEAVNQAVGLIGRNVTYTRSDGTTGSGVAQSVAISNGAVSIAVGSDTVDPSEITSVGVASSTTQATGTPSSGTQSTSNP